MGLLDESFFSGTTLVTRTFSFEGETGFKVPCLFKEVWLYSKNFFLVGVTVSWKDSIFLSFELEFSSIGGSIVPPLIDI